MIGRTPHKALTVCNISSGTILTLLSEIIQYFGIGQTNNNLRKRGTFWLSQLHNNNLPLFIIKVTVLETVLFVMIPVLTCGFHLWHKFYRALRSKTLTPHSPKNQVVVTTEKYQTTVCSLTCTDEQSEKNANEESSAQQTVGTPDGGHHALRAQLVKRQMTPERGGFAENIRVNVKSVVVSIVIVIYEM